MWLKDLEKATNWSLFCHLQAGNLQGAPLFLRHFYFLFKVQVQLKVYYFSFLDKNDTQ